MKKIIMILLAAVMALSFAACAGSSKPAEKGESTGSSQSVTDKSKELSETGNKSEKYGKTTEVNPDDSTSEPDNKLKGSRILVAYFSVTKNTQGVAQKLADGLGADLYEITPEQPYTDEDLNYNDSQCRSTIEMNDPSARPAISGSVENMEQYDTVFIGYPIWWGEAPRIMSTFMESYDFSGKTLVAFCTSASSGFGSSDSDLRTAANGATWLDGHRFSADVSTDDVLAWANGLGIS